MKWNLIFIVPLALSACGYYEQQPSQPSPEMQKIQAACQQGDLTSCKFIEESRQAELQRRASAPPPVYTPIYTNPADFQSKPQTVTNCRNNYGQVTCTTY